MHLPNRLNLSSASPVLGSRIPQRFLRIGLLACIFVLLLAYGSFHHENVGQWASKRFGGRGVPPDPLKQPGWREGDKWVNSRPDVQLHHWLQKMSDNEDGDHMDWARNKTILLLGDSVVRDWVWRLCSNHLHVDRHAFDAGSKSANSKVQGWECIVPQTNTRLVNGFIYGMTNYSRYPSSPFISREWPPGPWGFEDRIPDLAQNYSKYDPDMVVLNSGPWDFKFMFRRDLYKNLKPVDIEPQELHEYGERLRECMKLLRQIYPKKKLLFLQLHPFSGNDLRAKWFWAKGSMKGGHDYGIDFSPKEPNATAVESKLPPLFSRRRVSQLASTYRRVAAEENFDDLDYWKIAEATDEGKFIRPGDAIHPADPSIAVMLDWVLEKLWRWETYRHAFNYAEQVGFTLNRLRKMESGEVMTCIDLSMNLKQPQDWEAKSMLQCRRRHRSRKKSQCV